MKWLFALIPAALAASIPNVNLGEAPPAGQVDTPLQDSLSLSDKDNIWNFSKDVFSYTRILVLVQPYLSRISTK